MLRLLDFVLVLVFLTVGADVDFRIESSCDVVDEPPHAFLGDTFRRCSIGY